MRREIAEAFRPLYLCQLCMHCDGDENRMIDHMVSEHSDEEAIDATGWDLKDFPEDE